MQVFRPSDNSHTLKFISRTNDTDIILNLRNELRGNEDVIEISGTVTNDIFTGVFTYNFSEGGTYEIEVTNELEDLLYRGKAFATDVQDLQNYKLIR